jgi:hypothetical protein
MLNLIRVFTQIFLLLAIAAAQSASAELPARFVGEWNVRVETTPGFPYWDHIKYPVRLSINEEGAIFEDQAGFKCAPQVFFYDDELDTVIFKHCLPTKSELAIPPYYKMKAIGGRLLGETWTYKFLFRWTGEESK